MRFPRKWEAPYKWFALGVSFLLNVLLALMLLTRASSESEAEQPERKESKLLSVEELRERRARKEEVKEAIAEREQRLGNYPVGENWIKLPYAKAIQVADSGWLISQPDGKLGLGVYRLLQITPDERERIGEEWDRIYKLIRKHETDTAIVHSLDTESTVFEIPADAEFMDKTRSEIAAIFDDIVGSERGELLAKFLFWENRFLPQAGGGGFKVTIERNGDSTLFSERGHAPIPMREFNLELLQRRYGHVADLSAWGEFLYVDRIVSVESGSQSSDEFGTPTGDAGSLLDAIPSLLDYKEESMGEITLGFPED